VPGGRGMLLPHTRHPTPSIMFSLGLTLVSSLVALTQKSTFCKLVGALLQSQPNPCWSCMLAAQRPALAPARFFCHIPLVLRSHRLALGCGGRLRGGCVLVEDWSCVGGKLYHPCVVSCTCTPNPHHPWVRGLGSGEGWTLHSVQHLALQKLPAGAGQAMSLAAGTSLGSS